MPSTRRAIPVTRRETVLPAGHGLLGTLGRLPGPARDTSTTWAVSPGQAPYGCCNRPPPLFELRTCQVRKYPARAAGLDAHGLALTSASTMLAGESLPGAGCYMGALHKQLYVLYVAQRVMGSAHLLHAAFPCEMYPPPFLFLHNLSRGARLGLHISYAVGLELWGWTWSCFVFRATVFVRASLSHMSLTVLGGVDVARCTDAPCTVRLCYRRTTAVGSSCSVGQAHVWS